MLTHFRFAALILLLTWTAVPAHGAGLSLERAGLSDDMVAVRKSLDAATPNDLGKADTAWHLLRAFYRYYDELEEQGKDADRSWAADKARQWGEQAYAKYPTHPDVVYWSAMAGLIYLETNQAKALFIASGLLDRYEEARKLDPKIDDWGPDRMIGILSLSLPGWPISRGDNKKALPHLAKASKESPQRAVNRLFHARALFKNGQKAKALEELAFLEKGDWKVSSPHWRKLTEKNIRELAAEIR